MAKIVEMVNEIAKSTGGTTFSTVSLREVFYTIYNFGLPSRKFSRTVNAWKRKNLWNLARGFCRVVVAKLTGNPARTGNLYLSVIKANGQEDWYGLASVNVVTTAGVNFIVDAFQNIVELEIMKYHGIGTSSAAESIADTALGTELTTQYNPDNTRATGSLTEGATANVFRTIGTNTVDSGVTITEHGILSQAATGGGTLLDRSIFTGIVLANGDSLQSTYDLTVSAGG